MMRLQVHLFAIVFCVLLPLTFFPAVGQEDEPPPPRDIGLQETDVKGIVQVDVSTSGPAAVLRNLTAGDFQIVVDGREISKIKVDPVCSGQVAGAAGGVPESAADRQAGISYMFYFDQFHLKMDGRARALDLARELIPTLLDGSARAIVVSGGSEVRTYGTWTEDQAALLAALDELDKDPEQLDPYASGEDQRVAEVLRRLGSGLEDKFSGNMENRRALGDLMGDLGGMDTSRFPRSAKQGSLDDSPINIDAWKSSVEESAELLENIIAMSETADLHMAVQAAESHESSDIWQAEKGLNRFSVALGRFAGRSAPKAVLYFADNMRGNAGAHYLSLFSASKMSPASRRSTPLAIANDGKFRMTAGSTVAGYEEVLNQAAIHGVRLYTVQAEGLVTDDSMAGLSSSAGSGSYVNSFAGTRRHDDAKASLREFASSTGGRSFLNGVPGKKIARALIGDLSCIHLISFDAGGLPEDRPLALEVTVKQPKVTASARSHVIVESDSSRLESRIASAFTMPAEHRDDGGIRTEVIPTGFVNSRYTALVQLIIPGSNLPQGSWDLGLSLVARGGVRREVSGRVSVNRPGVPVVFEAEMLLQPGPYEIVAVAHDLLEDRILSQHIESDLPELKGGGGVVLGPLTLLQPAEGAFLRDGRARKRGALARSGDDHVDPDLPLVVVGLVCRSGRHDGSLTVERRLTGENTVPFPAQTIRFEEDHCFLIRDLVTAGTLSNGMFLYDMTVGNGEGRVTAGNLEFAAY